MFASVERADLGLQVYGGLFCQDKMHKGDAFNKTTEVTNVCWGHHLRTSLCYTRHEHHAKRGWSSYGRLIWRQFVPHETSNRMSHCQKFGCVWSGALVIHMSLALPQTRPHNYSTYTQFSKSAHRKLRRDARSVRCRY